MTGDTIQHIMSDSAASENNFVILPAPDRRSGRIVGGVQRAVTWLSILLFLLAVALLPLIFYTFWVTLEALQRAWNLPQTAGLLSGVLRRTLPGTSGWTFDLSFFLTTLMVWSILYLGNDHLGLLANPLLKRTLETKGQDIGPDERLIEERFFVDIRPLDVLSNGKGKHIRQDTGWLYLTTDRLHFIGNQQQFTLTRPAITDSRRSIRLQRSRFNLSGAWLNLPYGSHRSETMQILCRDDAYVLSDTTPATRRMGQILLHWFIRTPPASASAGSPEATAKDYSLPETPALSEYVK